jgi:hypothetical protein
MISLHELIYGLGLMVIAVVGFYGLVEIQGFLDKRHEKKVKHWGEEAIRRSRE